MLLIEIYFHFSAYKDFNHYYLYGICQEHHSKFGKLPCYQRFVAGKKLLFLSLTILIQSLKGAETGIYFADSPSVKVGHNKRISNHAVFKGLAAPGRSTMGWFWTQASPDP
jgi:hypothetical protein